MSRQFFYCFFIPTLLISTFSCSPDEEVQEQANQTNQTNQTSPSSNSLVGKWSFPDDGQLDYWTFYTNGTMLIEDESDSFNGGTTTYSFDSSNNQLTYFGFLVQTIYWDSPNQFHTLTQGYFHGATFTRVN